MFIFIHVCINLISSISPVCARARMLHNYIILFKIVIRDIRVNLSPFRIINFFPREIVPNFKSLPPSSHRAEGPAEKFEELL